MRERIKPYSEFGELVDSALKGNSQRWLAEFLEVNVATLSRWMEGHTKPSHDKVVVIAALLELDPIVLRNALEGSSIPARVKITR